MRDKEHVGLLALVAAALWLSAILAASAAHAELLVLQCRYHPLVGVGSGGTSAGENFHRNDVFEIDIAAGRAKGTALMSPSGAWSRVEVRSDRIRLSNGDPSACHVSGRRGEEVVINRYSGESQRSHCMGSGPRSWITLHWAGKCERIARRAF